jgi:hypothetical protein
MNLYRPVCVAALLALVSQRSDATDWWFVPAESSQDRSAAVYVEKSSMGRLRGTGKVLARVWNLYRQDQPADFGSYRSAKLKFILDCEKKEYGIDSGVYLTAFGGTVHQYRATQPAVAQIQPSSLQEIAATFMCSDGKNPPRALPVYDPGRDSEQRFLQYEREAQGRPEIKP